MESTLLTAADLLSIHTEPNPDCPSRVTTIVAFDYQTIDAWACQNPTACFRIPFKDGSPSPCVISAELYLEEKGKMV
jgi:hypothetical protein